MWVPVYVSHDEAQVGVCTFVCCMRRSWFAPECDVALKVVAFRNVEG
jgi:hypothetical protein